MVRAHLLATPSGYFKFIIIIEFVADKPKYEVGSSAKLSFGGNNKAKVAAVWKIDNDDDDEMIDADELLDAEDLAKPDPASLRGTCCFLYYFSK